MKQVFFICHSCQDINKQELGMPGFEVLQIEYESLTDAWLHLYTTLHSPAGDGIHHMEAIIKEE